MRQWCGILILVSFLLTFSKAHTQSLFKQPSIGLQGFYGSFLTRVPKAQYLRDSYSYSGELSIQRQTDGRYAWQRANGLPQVGLALFYGNTGSKQYLGNMAGVFPFITWKLFKTPAFQSSIRAGSGLGWIQKPYDKITNHKNVLIGTHGNAYVNFLWQNEVQLFSNVHINAGFSFSHFSNGSSTLPNLGLNISAFSVGLRYGPSEKTTVPKRGIDTFTKKIVFAGFTSVGIKQAPWIESKRYITNVLLAEWSRQFRSYGKYSGGAVLFYDRALEVNPNGLLDQKLKGTKLQAGVFVGYEHLLGKLSIPLQLGVYVYNPAIYTTLFQQIGLRYRITKNWSAQLAMKTHSGKADFIHLGFGYHFR